MNFESWFRASAPEIAIPSAAAVIKLAGEGSTVPFIARYRKEQTGNLDEVAIQKVISLKEKWEEIVKRQAFISEEIQKQGKLTDELKGKIASTFDLSLLEDLYLPYKVKRKTKAATAREAGLEPLANWIWECGHGTAKPEAGQTLELWALTFRNEEKKVTDAATAIAGAQDILIERLSENQELRQFVRKNTLSKGAVLSKKGEKAKPNSKYENYFEFSEPVSTLMDPKNSHRYLALRRGWMEEELVVNLGGKPTAQGPDTTFEEELLKRFEQEACTVPSSPGAYILKKAARLALKAHVFPSIENEIHKSLKDIADEMAIKVFAENVRKLLLASPFGSKAVLGVDPGIRTGCKVAIVDDSGKHIANTVIHLQSDDGKEHAEKLIAHVVPNGKISAIAVGNGTAGRETESFLRAAVAKAGLNIPVVMVSESGASVYSASEAAREEFPELDLTVRGAISIARRLQDPLAELVKVDPKSIGVGQYQHDVNQSELKKSLDRVVESCVNSVGVNLNTASYHLLAHVSGIGPGLAKNIVEYRQKKGLFKSREELLEVSRFTQKAFEQAAGFLRIPGAENPLDNTGIHPERYVTLRDLANQLKCKVSDFIGQGVSTLRGQKQLREEVGAFTFDDIVKELEKPGRDPREEFVPFHFREDIHEVKDLTQGMICPGIVTNVTNFGAFVDIGVHQDGLVHISQLSDQFVNDPRTVVSPGDHVQVRVLEINLEKNQIALTMKKSVDASERSERRPGGRSDYRQDSRDSRPSSGQRPGPRPHSGASPQHGARPQHGERRDFRADSGQQGSRRENFNDSGRDHRSHSGSGQRPGGKPAPRPAPSPFNNAFAGLAGLKDKLKK